MNIPKQALILTLLATCFVFNNAAQADHITTVKNIAIYKLGDIGPNGGKVFYLDEHSQHGLAAQLTDEVDSLSWSDAVTACAQHGTGWHLPTKTELELLWAQKNLVGGFVSEYYWSSTVDEDGYAWFQTFGTSLKELEDTSALGTRAILAF
jgi:hypothetical protein